MLDTSTFDQTRRATFNVSGAFILFAIPNLASDLNQIYVVTNDGWKYTADDTPYTPDSPPADTVLVNGLSDSNNNHKRYVCAYSESLEVYCDTVSMYSLPLPFTASDLGQTYNISDLYNSAVQGTINSFGIRFVDRTPLMYRGGDLSYAVITRKAGFSIGASSLWDTSAVRNFTPKNIYGNIHYTYDTSAAEGNMLGAFPDPSRTQMQTLLRNGVPDQYFPAPKIKCIRYADASQTSTRVEFILHASYYGTRANMAGEVKPASPAEAATIVKSSIAANSVPSTSTNWSFLHQYTKQLSQIFQTTLRDLCLEALKSRVPRIDF